MDPAEPTRGMITRSMAARAAAYLSEIALSDLPGEIDLLMAQILSEYYLVYEKLKGSEGFLKWASTTIGISESKADHAKKILDGHLYVYLVTGPLFAGRVSPENRKEYLNEHIQALNHFHAILQQLLRDDQVAESLEYLEKHQPKLPSTMHYGDELGYYPFKILNDQNEGLMRRASSLENMLAEDRRHDAHRKEAIERADATANSALTEIRRHENRLKNSRTSAVKDLEEAMRLAERNTASLKAAFKERENEAQHNANTAVAKIEEESKRKIAAMRRDAEQQQLRFVQKRKVVYFVYESSYVDTWLQENFPANSLAITARRIPDGWFAGCPLPDAVLLVNFIEEPSGGLSSLHFEQSRQCMDALVAQSNGKCRNSVVVRMQMMQSAGPSGLHLSDRLCSEVASSKVVVYAPICTMLQEDGTQQRCIGSDREEWTPAATLKHLISKAITTSPV